jgi:benzoate membrane transport protein
LNSSFPEKAEASRAGLLQPIVAGVLAAVVGYASTFALVLAAYAAVGASPAEAGSGLFAICVALGLLNTVISWRLKMPLSFAWSTPGAAFLLTAGEPVGGYPAVAGAFLMTAGLIVLAGLWAPFARAVAAIPAAIANAMLAGILLTLCLAPLKAVAELPLLALPIVLSWAIALRLARRYAVPIAVAVTAIILAVTADLPPGAVQLSWPVLVPVMPAFTLDAFLRIALPLFIVTMASQNLPGLAVMKANGYDVRPAPQFVLTGLVSAALAFVGGHTVNLAAITAAICAGPEAHPDPAKRWLASFAAGWTYLVLALIAGLAASFIAASPPLLIEAVAGLALLSSLSSSLANALAREEQRLPAILTFVTAASGITIFGIGAAFWGLVAGIGLLLLQRSQNPPAVGGESVK